MEKLLNIREAAEFLNVSEMSIRRWTNSGNLKCYRIGGKKERRFRIQDLRAFLLQGEDLVSLGTKGMTVKSSAHVSHFYHREDEALDMGLSYIQEGISRGEMTLVVSPEKRLKKLLAGLDSRGLRSEMLGRKGILHWVDGMRDFSSQVEFMAGIVEKAGQHAGFRLLGDMVWAKAKGWDLQEIHALEDSTNSRLMGERTLFLCQYDVRQFQAEAAMMAMETHGYTVYRNDLKPSPYFNLQSGTARHEPQNT